MTSDFARFGTDGFRQIAPDASRLCDDLPELPLVAADPLFLVLSEEDSPLRPSALAAAIKHRATVFESIDGSATILVVKPTSVDDACVTEPLALRLKKLDAAVVLTDVATLRSCNGPCSAEVRRTASRQAPRESNAGKAPARSAREAIMQKQTQAAVLDASRTKKSGGRHLVFNINC